MSKAGSMVERRQTMIAQATGPDLLSESVVIDNDEWKEVLLGYKVDECEWQLTKIQVNYPAKAIGVLKLFEQIAKEDSITLEQAESKVF